MARLNGTNPEQRNAVNFLVETLEYSNESYAVRDIMEWAAARGISRGTLILAKAALPIISTKVGKAWEWSLVGDWEPIVDDVCNRAVPLHEVKAISGIWKDEARRIQGMKERINSPAVQTV
jgi:hypothetical protein